MTTQNIRQKLSRFGSPKVWAVAILFVVITGLIMDTTKADNSVFYNDIMRLDNVATRIHQNYVQEISSEELVDNAIKGMMDILDPHSSFFKKDEYEELRIHTEGKFGGLGIQISIRDKILTVMTPIGGTPASRAGIQSGDQIMQIDGKSTQGMALEVAVAQLRGEPGSEVKLSILRKGETKPLEFTITREIITIKSVPYWGFVDKEIGYILLTTFSQESGDEIEKALRELLKQNMKGLILDLRHNPGGLLPQAIEISEKFLEKNSMVVFTRGRIRNQNKDFHASINPVLPKDIPMVVLVNSASASASEIVAGAIQDWDRGVILGDTTFGKGSVQSILPLDKDHHLKLTTAFYYTPSGRCINKPENSFRGTNGGDSASVKAKKDGSDSSLDQNELIPLEDLSIDKKKDSVAVKKDTVEYKTKGGRVVYGGGGIIPDIIVKPKILDPVIRSLLLKDVFFKYSNLRFPSLMKQNMIIDSGFTVNDKIMVDFHKFLDSIKFNYQSYTNSKFYEFQTTAGLVKDTSKDSSITKIISALEKPNWSSEELKELKRLTLAVDSLIKKEETREMDKSEGDVKYYLRESLLVRSLGQDNPQVFRSKLSHDEQVTAAISLIQNKKSYLTLLQPKKK
ncbi:MAG: S41 family peptidase [Chitinivibrionales bacterium]|nr:S41 family peptidase [Chitinivibrionales bacterium]